MPSKSSKQALLWRAAALLTSTLHACSHDEPAEPLDDRTVLIPTSDEAPLVHAPGEPHPFDRCDGSVCERTGPALLHSGEFEEVAVDLRVPGVGLDFVWVRRYRSRVGTTSAQGVGWDFSYDIYVQPTATPGVVRLHDGFNQEVELSAGTTGQYTAPGLHRVGSYDATGAFVVTFADGGTWRFRPDTAAVAPGRIDQIADRNGNALGFAYDASGRLVTVTDTLDREYAVAYDADGFIASVTDFTGRQVTYAYHHDGDPGGSAGDLAAVTLPAIVGTSTGNDFPAGRTTSYTYTVGGVDPSLDHNLLTITNAKGDVIVANEYGQSGLALDRLALQAHGRPDALYELTYHATTGAAPGMQTWVNDPEGFVRVHTFDVDNREVSRVVYDEPANPLLPSGPGVNVPTGPSFETQMAYDADHQLVSVEHPSGIVEELVYETGSPLRRGNIVEHRLLDASGSALVTEYEYDPRFGNDHAGTEFATSIVDPTLVWAEQTFDAHGNRLTWTNGDVAQSQTWSYDARGRLVQHVGGLDAQSHREVTEHEYYGAADGHQEGYLARTVEDVGGLELTTEWVYDALGRSIERIDPDGSSTLREFNAADQIVREHGPLENGLRRHDSRIHDAEMGLVRVEYQNVDDQGVVDSTNPTIDVEYVLDALGNPVEVRDELASGVMRVDETEYDRNQNPTVHRTASAVAGQTVAETTHYTWGGRGLVSRVEGAGSTAALTITYERDADGRVVAEEHAGSGQVRRWETEHDGWGRATITTDPMGNVTRLELDDAGRVLSTRFEGELSDVPGSSGNVLLAEHLTTYDATGRQAGSSRRWFDPSVGPGPDWVGEARVLDGTGHPYQTTDARGATTFRYDDTAGRPTSSFDAVGNESHVTRDPAGRPIAREQRRLGPGGMTISTLALDFDALADKVGELSPMGAPRTWRHDSRGNVRVETDGRVGTGTTGNAILHGHDAAGRETSTHYVLTADGSGSGAVVGGLQVSTSYDHTGRVTDRTDPLGHTTTFAHDDRGRLASRTYPDGSTETLVHDAFGDLVRQIDAAGTEIELTRDLLGRVTAVSAVPGVGVDPTTTWETFQYDGMGHIVGAQDSDSDVSRKYDSLGNLVEETINRMTTEATYDPYGKLETLVMPSGEVIEYVRDLAGRIESIEHDGVVVAELVHRGPAVATRVFPEPGLASTFGHDLEGRVVSVTHALGTTSLEDLDYTLDPEGQVELVDSLAGNGARTLAYDSVGRTTTALHVDPVVGTESASYVYDANGNWTSVAGRAAGCNGSFTIDPLSNQYDATPCEQLAYDGAGSLTSIVPITAAGRDRDYVYDHRRRLVQVTDQGPLGPVVTSIGYDALGRIHTVMEVATGPAGPVISTRQRAHLGLRDVEHVTDTQVLDHVFDDTRDGHVLLRIDAGTGQRTYFAEDGLGSTILAVTGSAATGWAHERVAYGDYGQPTFVHGGVASSTSALGVDRLLAGLVWHPGIGLYETGTRMLDPKLGRFINVDVGGRWDDATALGNGYVYAGAQPFTSTDRSGRWKTPTYKNGWSSTERANMEGVMLPRAQNRAWHLQDQLDWVTHKLVGTRDRYYTADNLSAYFGGYFTWAAVSELSDSANYINNRVQGDVIVFMHASSGNCAPGTNLAWTLATRHAWIRICKPNFWSFTPGFYVMGTPSSTSYSASWNSASGTVLHEIAHNAGVAVGDKRYATLGRPDSMQGQWPSDNPYAAKHNADSFELAALDCAFGLGAVRCN